MRWEHLVPSEFEKAVKETGVCIVPLGSLERHGEYLPFGCDMIIAETIANLAVEIEPAVVFPPQYLGQVHEAAVFTGTVNYPQAFAIEAFAHLMDAIAANGFKKIFVVNAHGGNSHFLDYFSMSRLDEPTTYDFYATMVGNGLNEAERARYDAIWESSTQGHACESETSLFMACCPGKARLDLTPQESIEPLGRFQHLRGNGIHNALWWYADFPQNVVGNASLATAEKGKAALELYVQALARQIKIVKEDAAAAELQTEFSDKVRRKGDFEKLIP